MSIIYRCRLCLKSCRNKIDVFKDDFPRMIEILTGLKVDPCDDFPKTSCIDCAKNVKNALKTRKLIIQSHKVLLEEFLAKCREIHILDSEVTDKSNSDGTGIDKRVTETEDSSCRTESAIATRKSSRHLKITKIDQTLSKSDNRISEVVINVKEEYLEVPPSINASRGKLADSNGVKDADDSNSGDPSSPLSDPTGDVDWEPDKDEIKSPECVEESNKPNINKHPIKGSDGVFFVKKRRTPTVRKPKSQETIVRIKKKTKGRVPPSRVTCEVCKREVQSYWLQKHMETHEYNPVTCEFCGLVSKSATALRHHVFYYHRSAADEYMCDQCGRNFRSKYRLNLHKKKEHGGTKDFECTTCGKKFFERMHLKRHVDKTHKNIRPYVCDFCGKSFKSKNHIKIHERIHSKEAPYNCHMCGESFKMKLTLRTHLKGVHNVHEEQKVFCDICQRGFASDVALKAHLNSRIHETEKCQYCSEMFTREYMVNHLREFHGMGEHV